MGNRSLILALLLGMVALMLLLGKSDSTIAGVTAPPSPTATIVVPSLIVNSATNPVPVAPQGTQNVNVVGGVLNAGPPVASKSSALTGTLAYGQGDLDVVVNGITTTINTSLIQFANSSAAMDIQLLGPGISFHINLGSLATGPLCTFPQRIPINRLHLNCFNYYGCPYDITLVGD